MTTEKAEQRLTRLIADAPSLEKQSLREKLLWLEDAVFAAEAVAVDDDDDANAAALHLKAALGAIIKWSQGDKNPETLPQLDAVVRTLMARGLLGMTRVLAARYGAIAELRPPHRAACIEARDALLEVARALEKGTPPSTTLQARLSRLKQLDLG